MPVLDGRRSSDAGNNRELVAVYVYAIITLTFLAVTAVLGIVLLRPTSPENSALIAAVLGVIVPSNISLMALIQQESHKSLNSRMDQIVGLRRAEGYTEGLITGATASGIPVEPSKLLESIKPPPLP